MIRAPVLSALLLASAASFHARAGADLPAFELGLPGPDGSLGTEVPADSDLTLRLRGTWRDACLPVLAGFHGSGHRRLLTLEVSPPDRVCAQVLTPFELDIPGVRFDAEDGGHVEVAVIESDAAWLARSVLSVQPGPQASGRFSLYDVSGTWFDPARAGSGLILSHLRFGGSERVAGGWMNFGSDGHSQWHLLSDARWVTSTVLLGTVHRARTQPFACTLQFPNFECDFSARPASSIDPVARFELRMIDADRAVLTFGEPSLTGTPPPDGSLLTGYRVELQRL